jgi:TonB family protein
MRERLVISVLLAILVHFVLLLVLQLALQIERSRVPEYSGPLYVTLADAPLEQPVVEQAREPRRAQPEPAAPRSEQAAGEQRQPTPEPGAPPASAPHLRPAPLPETGQPQTGEQPRTGLRMLPPETTPRSDERYLPTEQEAYQAPPAQRRSDETPVPSQAVPAPRETEVRPEKEPEQPPVLDLGRLDSNLSGQGGGEATDTGTRTGGEAGRPGAAGGTAAAQEGREGVVIHWDNPAEGREAIDMPKPVLPKWVSEQGERLQVVVSFELTPEGVLRDVKVEHSSGYSKVDAAVLDALRRWRFRPVSSNTMVNGEVTYTIIPR